MAGRLRVPSCFLSRLPYTTDLPKFNLFSIKKMKKNWSVIPLLAIQTCVLVAIPLLSCYKMFFTAIDVQLGGYQRFEIPSIPRFIDLRNPRVFKLVKMQEWKPAIHLDNRYRLMRNEPMLDANGNETDDIGEDETAPPNMEEAYEKALKMGPSLYFPKI
ncbi:uncharacterized protein LOC128886040 isoform X2 [Hylaeus anthracinus]|uniref:uncharacterized protein LOC128886040 isoform X2 n=1 Tax=Hylaeus anthracinus TaxID=313031 RepID=UPI0023B966EF|nr:uncharacterized protein LOC128886040 isoform X2 [Hylaeus anthracinus]